MKLILAAAPATAPAGLPVIRANTGLRFEIPTGWEWMAASNEGVFIQHLGTRADGESPIFFQVRGLPSYMDFLPQCRLGTA